MKKISFFQPTAKDSWVLQNKDVSLAVEKASGFIRSLYFKARKLDMFQIKRMHTPGFLGYVRVYDELEGKWYSDLTDSFRVSAAVKRGNKISFTKRFAGAAFVLDITLGLDDDGLSWELTARKRSPTLPDRSIRVGFNFPLQPGWEVWAPCSAAPFGFTGVDDFHFNHVQVSFIAPTDIILPMCSHYNKDLGVGYSMAVPMGDKVPALRFQFENGQRLFFWNDYARKTAQKVQTLEALHFHIGLVGKRPAKARVMMFFHEGDWRCGLGKVYKRWQEYFDPDSPCIYDYEGVFNCGGVSTGSNTKAWTDLGLKTLEVHGHFCYYADYFQEGRDEWTTVGALERVRRAWEQQGKKRTEQEVWDFVRTAGYEQIADIIMPDWRRKGAKLLEEVYHTRRNIHQQLDRIRRAGIAPFWYFNFTDGFRPIADVQWPDGICRDQDGKPIPSGWHMCHNMLADLSTTWGQFCQASVRKIVRHYPQIVGFFLDCFRHYEISFAHDDGVSVVDNRPGYSVNFSYDDICRAMKEIMNASGRKMALFANKPQTIRSMRHVDGVLLEGDGDVAEEKYFYACIAKPNFFMWGSTRAGVDENLRRSVVLGAYPRVAKERSPSRDRSRLGASGVDAPGHDELVKLYRKYLPLYAQFRRRVLCFEPDPMRIPRGARGKLFTVKDSYVAGIATLPIDSDSKLEHAKTPYALFRLKRGHDVGKVGVMYPGDKTLRAVKFKFNGSIVAVPLKDYHNCAVVKLFVTGRSGKKIGPEKFTGPVDFCGDPESAFADISKR